MSTWSEQYTDSKYINEVKAKYFEGSPSKMADAIRVNVTSLHGWLAPEGKVPPHVNRLCELYIEARQARVASTLKMFLVLVDRSEEERLRMAVGMCRGEIQELKGVG